MHQCLFYLNTSNHAQTKMAKFKVALVVYAFKVKLTAINLVVNQGLLVHFIP